MEKYIPLDDDAGELKIKRNVVGPVTVTLLLVAALGLLAFKVLTSYSVSADKVLIAVTVPDSPEDSGQWWDDEQGVASRAFVSGIKGSMEAVGFTVIDPRKPEYAAALAGVDDESGLVSAARSLGAGVLIHGRLSPVQEEAAPNGAWHELILEGDLKLRLTGHEGPDSERTVPVRRMQAGPDRQDAVRMAASSVSSFFFDEIVAAIVTMPDVAALFDKETRTPEQAQVAQAIKRAYNFNDLRDRAMKKRHDLIASAQARWEDQDAGRAAITQLSPFGREDYLVGVFPGGQGVIGTVKERRFFMKRETLELANTWLPERQDFIGDKGASHTVFEAYNIYGYPGLSRDGETLAVTTDDNGAMMSLRVIKIDPASGQSDKARVIYSIPKGVLSFPRPSPDGRRVLVQHKTCRRCNGSLEMIDVATGQKTVVFKGDDWRGVGSYDWVGAEGKIVSYVVYHETTGRRVVLHDLSTDESKVLQQDGDGFSFINNSFSNDGTLMAFVQGGPQGRQLAVMTLSSGEVKTLTQGVYVKRPAFSHDNRYLAFEATGNSSSKDRYRRDHEIAVIDLKAPIMTDDEGEEVLRPLHYLTVNDLKDRHMRWAPDAHQLYFETITEDPQIDEPWVAIRSLNVQAALEAP